MAGSNTAAKAQSAPTVPASDGARYLPRVKQVQWDHYYTDVALTVMTRANCWGALVGAVLVLDNRIVSTGFNGTPAGFANCRDGGCERCRQRELHDRGELQHITDPEVASGPKQLDLCLCVHAEANALLSAAKFGNRTEGAWLYTTSKPCFACLKESYQAGVKRIVYLEEWSSTAREVLQAQYDDLAEHLTDGHPRNFEQLVRQRDVIADGHGQPRDPILDDRIDQLAGTAQTSESARADRRAAKGKSRAKSAGRAPQRS
jgi:dCMP deaminase